MFSCLFSGTCPLQGLSMEAIASQRAVQLSTVQSFIAETLAAGFSYPWHRMKLPFSILASLCGHVRAYHKQQLLADARLLEQQQSDADGSRQDRQQQQHQAALGECHEGPEVQPLSVTGCHGVCIRAGGLDQGGQYQQQQQYDLQHEQHRQPQPEQKSECHQPRGPLPVQQAAAVLLHSNPAVVGNMSKQAVCGTVDIMQGHAVCSHCALWQGIKSIWLQPNGQVFPCGDSSMCLAAAQLQSQQPVQLPDMQLMRELVTTNKGTKAIRDSLDTLVLSHGHMRLALAHIYCLLRHHLCFCQQTHVVRH